VSPVVFSGIRILLSIQWMWSSLALEQRNWTKLQRAGYVHDIRKGWASQRSRTRTRLNLLENPRKNLQTPQKTLFKVLFRVTVFEGWVPMHSEGWSYHWAYHWSYHWASVVFQWCCLKGDYRNAFAGESNKRELTHSWTWSRSQIPHYLGRCCEGASPA
jgi:hypothetical protein